MLFVLYINGLPKSINNYIYLFADDTKLFRIITSPIGQEVLQPDLDKIMNRSSDWQLPFNTSKWKRMHITNIKTLLTVTWFVYHPCTHVCLVI